MSKSTSELIEKLNQINPAYRDKMAENTFLGGGEYVLDSAISKYSNPDLNIMMRTIDVVHHDSWFKRHMKGLPELSVTTIQFQNETYTNSSKSSEPESVLTLKIWEGTKMVFDSEKYNLTKQIDQHLKNGSSDIEAMYLCIMDDPKFAPYKDIFKNTFFESVLDDKIYREIKEDGHDVVRQRHFEKNQKINMALFALAQTMRSVVISMDPQQQETTVDCIIKKESGFELLPINVFPLEKEGMAGKNEKTTSKLIKELAGHFREIMDIVNPQDTHSFEVECMIKGRLDKSFRMLIPASDQSKADSVKNAALNTVHIKE